MPKQYRKKPVVIEAVQFNGLNDQECLDFCPIARDPVDDRPNLVIPTLEGDMLVSLGDYIIKGVQGEFYPCKPDIFEATYEAVDGDPICSYSEDVDAVARELVEKVINNQAIKLDLSDEEKQRAFLKALKEQGIPIG